MATICLVTAIGMMNYSNYSNLNPTSNIFGGHSLYSTMIKKKSTQEGADQPLKIWAFVIGLNLIAWIGWYFMHDAPSKW